MRKLFAVADIFIAVCAVVIGGFLLLDQAGEIIINENLNVTFQEWLPWIFITIGAVSFVSSSLLAQSPKVKTVEVTKKEVGK